MSKHLIRAKKQIELGKDVELVKQSLALHFLELDRQEFEAKLRAEYDELFYVDETQEIDCNEDGSYDLDEDGVEIKTKVFRVLIDDAPTLEEYRNETRVVSEAVEATYDEEGLELTPYVAEVTELVRPYVSLNGVELQTLCDADIRIVEYKATFAKNAIATTLEKLTVTIVRTNIDATTTNLTFDATLESRQNLADAILASATLGLTETVWRLADNTELLVTLDELKEAHALALQAYAQAKAIGV